MALDSEQLFAARTEIDADDIILLYRQLGFIGRTAGATGALPNPTVSYSPSQL
jgi:hypothetical protein